MIIFCRQSLHVGSMRDLLRWCLVVPAYSGMLLTSILALKHAPMTLVVTFRALSPLLSLGIERLPGTDSGQSWHGSLNCRYGVGYSPLCKRDAKQRLVWGAMGSGQHHLRYRRPTAAAVDACK